MKNFIFLFTAFTLFLNAANAQIVSIPDANFKNLLVNGNCANIGISTVLTDVDTNNDGEIQVTEAAAVTGLWVIYSYQIQSFEGIEYFMNLEYLKCEGNQLLTSLDLNGLVNLQFLDCVYNQQLTNLNIQGCTNLNTIYCYNNQITSLNVQGLINLHELDFANNQLTSIDLQGLNLIALGCGGNPLTSLDIQNLTNLEILGCNNNRLSNLDVQNFRHLTQLYCYDNQLTSLNLQGLTQLHTLQCQNNQLTTLDITDTRVYTLICNNNQLTSLFMKNSIATTSDLYFSNNPNLSYICCDNAELAYVKTKATQAGYNNCTVNSYCSFTPGGTFYVIQGNTKYDENTNGCDTNDITFPNMKFNIRDSINIGNIISNASGTYNIPVEAGTHTIKPVLENPTYFIASPDSIQITFPNATSDTLTQNFCITPNGTHHDVETTLIPTTSARPGFDASYKIIFKNKGNQTENGVVSFGFDNAKMDMVSTSIAPTTTATGSRMWAYTALKPFETRTIDVVLNINTPMETPAVNAGDVLGFTSNITLGATDELPSDNAAVLNQTVVGSLDPNDKTCSEGRQIALSKVGDFLHYTIRFENTGTANATNIVVKDIIDLAKYDIASLQMLKASHDCRVRVLNNNQVEFIFENINLPFTAPNKYGYVTFKIKTKSTLVLGDIASNKADIFFDYNFPIVTNTASTQVANVLAVEPVLELAPFELNIQPNPVADILTLKTDATIEKCEIFDAVGRVLQSSGVQNQQINVSHLPKGIYFLKAYSKDGFAVRKFVKA